MVVKVLKPSGSTSSPLEYNENKVSEGNAEIIGVFCKGEGDDDIYETFKRLERRNIRTQNVSFHMAINPGEGENMSAGRICSFACDLMQGLGYGNQPFIIYRHHDIERIHYHLVSCRVMENGRKVNDSLEHWKCKELTKELQTKYGYTIGKKDSLTVADPEPPGRFRPKRGNVSVQLATLYDECLRYHFTSFRQFRNILLSHGVKLHIPDGMEKTFFLKGLDENGKIKTAPLGNAELDRNLYQLYSTALRSGKLTRNQFRPERVHLENAVRVAMKNSWSKDEFREALLKHDIEVIFSHDRNGKLNGAEFISNVSRCAMDIDEMPSVNLDMIEDMENQSEKNHETINELMDVLLSGANQGSSKEKDMKDDPELKKKKHKMKIR